MYSKYRIRRRAFLKLGGMAAVLAAAAGCAKPGAPTAAPAAEATAAPAGATAVPPAGTGKYKEAPMLAELVKAGKLPPVDERLPEGPMVVAPTHEIGQYGGTFRSFMTTDSDQSAPWDVTQSVGFFAVPRDVTTAGAKFPLEGWEPQLCSSYSWNADATELTLNLRKGIKWSDGVPFTSDDIVFSFNDVIMNEDVYGGAPGWAVLNGKPLVVSAPDAYTVVFKFPEPYPGFMYRLWMLGMDNLCEPKHFVSQYHPKYTATAEYKDIGNYLNHVQVGRPVVTPWIVKSIEAGKQITCERNPYYFGVDPEGNQLPYCDGVTFPMLGTTDNAVLKAIGGEIDIAERNMQALDKLPLLKQNEERGKYKILLWANSAFTQGTVIGFDYWLQDPDQPELREMLLDVDFRRALSLAMDRDDINQTLYQGLGRPATWALGSKSPYWDEEMEAIVSAGAKRDLEAAGALLDKLGLTDRNGDGIREYPSGKNVVIVHEACTDSSAQVRLGEMVVRNWKDLGIDARLHTTPDATFSEIKDSYTWHTLSYGCAADLIPILRAGDEPFNMWRMRKSSWEKFNETPPDAILEVLDLQQKLYRTADAAEVKKLYKEIARLRVDNVLDPHVVADLPTMIIRSDRMGNVPDEGYAIFNVAIEKPEQFYIKS